MDPSQPLGQVPNPRPKNWLIESILVTIFCCLPFWIVGIINSSSVNSKYDAGDYAGALNASQQAGKWTKIGFWIGLACIILYCVFMFFVGFSFLGGLKTH